MRASEDLQRRRSRDGQYAVLGVHLPPAEWQRRGI